MGSTGAEQGMAWPAHQNPRADGALQTQFTETLSCLVTTRGETDTQRSKSSGTWEVNRHTTDSAVTRMACRWHVLFDPTHGGCKP